MTTNLKLPAAGTEFRESAEAWLTGTIVETLAGDDPQVKIRWDHPDVHTCVWWPLGEWYARTTLITTNRYR